MLASSSYKGAGSKQSCVAKASACCSVSLCASLPGNESWLSPAPCTQCPASPRQEEGIAIIEPLADLDHLTPELKETLLCFVLVGPGSQHAFCSR